LKLKSSGTQGQGPLSIDQDFGVTPSTGEHLDFHRTTFFFEGQRQRTSQRSVTES
jgi:hypothetical protein